MALHNSALNRFQLKSYYPYQLERPLMSPLTGTNIHCNILTRFSSLIDILRTWESLFSIRPDCHYHFDDSGPQMRCLTS